MATRPVFVSTASQPFVERVDTQFKYYSGFAVSQAQKSAMNLHEAFSSAYPEHMGKLLEISSKSEIELGVRLSAFNLMYTMRDGSRHTVETVFQSGKCFENGRQYIDLLNGTSYGAKKDERLRSSGKVIGFRLEDVDFPTEPITYFYDWLYINAVNQNRDLANRLLNYNAFTDIAFNPAKSWNCQARSAAVYVGLANGGMLKKALSSPNDFLDTVYRVQCQPELVEPHQIKLWELMK